MIKNIKHLKNFGIFKDYSQTNKDVQDFNKFNLIYGWNGSGKTTLVSLFELLKKKKLPDRFSSSEFSITMENKNKITQKNLSKLNLNLHIFNNSFIKENIDWDNSVKSILLIAEEKIGERKQLNQLKEKQQISIKNNQKIENDIRDSEKEILKFMTQTAKSIKQNLQTIDTNDNYFMNYDKRKLEQFMNENKKVVKEKSSLLKETQVKQCIEGAKPNKKDKIELNLPVINFEKLKTKETEISKLLSKSVVSNTIERFVLKSDIQSWVETGIKIHKKHKSDKCEFCNNTLPVERIKQLEGHFNKEFENFKNNLQRVSESISGLFIQIDDKLPSREKFYKEFEENFKKDSNNLISTSKEINNLLEKWKNLIQEKIKNPFNTSLVIDSLDEFVFQKLNSHIENIKKLVEKHNQKTNNFEIETKKRKKALELHYATEKIKNFNYYQKMNNLAKQKNNIKELDKQDRDRKTKIQKLEASLSNEGIGAQKINSHLYKFLGRNNLSLKFNKKNKGYDIIRDQEEQHSQYLSEGEKRAIAFIYFITKLTEKNNKVKDSIIVIDDPMSSFDSNNLFQAYSFLRSHCGKAKQLFVFTHNFTYFKLVRDWLIKRNKNRKREKQSNSPTAHFFIVNAKVSIPHQNNELENMSNSYKKQSPSPTDQGTRNAKLDNMPDSLLKYNSEYHYIFESLFNFKDSSNLDINQAFLTANLSRKLLESFFYFKYPKHRSDLGILLDTGLTNCKKTTPEIKEKIHNFINKYSHSDKIEINEDTAENLMGESYPVIRDIFKWIEEVDKTHYNEMVKVVERKG